MRLLFGNIIICLLISCGSDPLTYEQGLERCKAYGEITWVKSWRGDSLQRNITIPDYLVGAYLPDFSVVSLDGRHVNRDSLHGKMNIINFWFETCTPCVAEIPGFNALVDKYGHDQINYLAFSTDSEDSMREFLEKKPFNFIQIPRAKKTISEVFISMWGYPLTNVTDKQGVILTAFSGGGTDEYAPQELIDKIEPLIMEELGL